MGNWITPCILLTKPTFFQSSFSQQRNTRPQYQMSGFCFFIGNKEMTLKVGAIRFIWELWTKSNIFFVTMTNRNQINQPGNQFHQLVCSREFHDLDENEIYGNSYRGIWYTPPLVYNLGTSNGLRLWHTKIL